MDISPHELLALAQKRIAQTKLSRYEPYEWQMRFHNSLKREKMLMAANRVGKTFAAAAEVAYDATGIYPDWWRGLRIPHAPLIWSGSVTNETSRDIVQKELFGGVGEDFGSGAIPADKLEKPSMRMAGVGNVIDTVQVKHVSGKKTTIVMKTYDQGWRKWQGTAPDVIWLDEEPDDSRLFSEAQTRLMTTRGKMLVTFTPLLGETDLVRHFTAGIDGTELINATWDDAPHLSKEDKDMLMALYPEHERETRMKGIPMMGEGRVFTVSEDDIKCEPFAIPAHWARICGIDLGINKDHPWATAWIAHNRDTDVVYLYDAERRSGSIIAEHASVINGRGKWIPVSWPHDGINKEKSGGREVIQIYKDDYGVNTLPISARYERDKGGGQPVEPIVMEILERCKTGRFKVFSNLGMFFEEYRGLHRKNGKIVAHRDDLLKATFYAVMMLRYAINKTEASGAGGFASQSSAPIMTMRL